MIRHAESIGIAVTGFGIFIATLLLLKGSVKGCLLAIFIGAIISRIIVVIVDRHDNRKG